jgi:hypothetical protein
VTTFFFGVSKINNLPLKYPNNCGSWGRARRDLLAIGQPKWKRFPWVRPFPEKSLMATEDEKTSIRRMGNRIIPVQEMLRLFPRELPAGVEFLRENIIGHFNGEQGKRILLQVFT